MSREAVLLQWERKIEAAERRPNRFDRAALAGATSDEGATVEELRPNEDATHAEPHRFEQNAIAPAGTVPVAAEERRTVTIAGKAAVARRRSSLMESHMAQPDRIALWAFLLGLFLVAVAAGTAHA